MKRVLSILVVSLLFLSSCEDELDSVVYDQLAPESFFQTEADFASAITALYSPFKTDGTTDASTGLFEFDYNIGFFGYEWSTGLMTDQAVDLWGIPELSQFTFGPSTYEDDRGRQHYGKIRYVARATDIIDQITKNESLNEDVVNAYVAEAKALRAIHMAMLYDLYGPLNPILDPAKLSNTESEPRMSKADYIAAIEKDITEALPFLPEKLNGDANNWGRVSQGVANMFLFKLYLNEKDWTKAEEIGNDIMALGYSLEPNYEDVFLNVANNELIFALPGNPAELSFWYNVHLPADADEVLGIDVNAGWESIRMPWSFYDKFEPGDRRLNTLADEYLSNSGELKSRENTLLTSGAIIMKRLAYVPNFEGYEYVMHRYADVILAMAEIENELNGPTGKAIQLVQQITDRAGTTIPDDAITSQDAFRDFILDERGRELYNEFGIRRQDLIRHGKFISSARERGLNAGDHQVLFPIPAHVVIESGGVVEQNPGYSN